MNFLRRRKILKAHKILGFPNFSKPEQIEMVLKSDYSKIANLTHYGEWTYDLLDSYITITPEELSEHLYTSGIYKNILIEDAVEKDGIWILKSKEEKYEFIDQERGVIYKKENFTNLEFAINQYAKVILRHIPKYEKLYQ